MPIPSENETLRMLEKEKHYKIKIKRSDNPNYVTERVFVNGVCIQIPVGEFVDVPETVKILLERKEVI